jgi:hypothetical protein
MAGIGDLLGGVVGGLDPLGLLGGGGGEGGGAGGLLGGVLGGGEGGGAGGLLGGLLGGGDPISGLIGAAGDALGLPKELTGALKIGAGFFTGDVMSVVSGGAELIGSAAQDLSKQTKQSFDRPSSSVAGYAPEAKRQVRISPPVRQPVHHARPVHGARPPPSSGTDIDINVHIHSHHGGQPLHRPPPPGKPVHVPSLPTRQPPTDGACTSGTSGTDGAKPTDAMQAQYDTLKTLEENFDQIDMRYMGPLFGHDGHIDMDDLQHLSASANCPPDVKRAVRSLMENPELYQKLARSGGAITRSDIEMAMDDTQKQISNSGASSTSGTSGASGDDSQTNGTDATDGSSQASGTNDPSKSGGASGDIGSQITQILGDPSMSIEEKIEAVLMLIEQDLDNQIGDTMQQMADGQSKAAGNDPKDKAAAEKSQNGQEQLNQKLQQLMERRKSMFDLMSNIDSKFNEMSSLAIQNLGKA